MCGLIKGDEGRCGLMKGDEGMFEEGLGRAYV